MIDVMARQFKSTALVSLMASMAPLAVMLLLGARPYYENQDDIMMERLVSVGIWGIPQQSVLYYQSSRLGSVLFHLYQWLPGISWYPLLQVGSLITCLFSVAYNAGKEKTPTVAVFIGLCLGALWLPHILSLQFTRVAIITTATAIFLILHDPGRRWALLAFALLSFGISCRSHGAVMAIGATTGFLFLYMPIRMIRLWKSMIAVGILTALLLYDISVIQRKQDPILETFLVHNSGYGSAINYQRFSEELCQTMGFDELDRKLLIAWLPLPFDVPGFDLERFNLLVSEQAPSFSSVVTHTFTNFKRSALTWYVSTFFMLHPMVWGYFLAGLILTKLKWKLLIAYLSMWVGLALFGWLMIHYMKMVFRVWEPLCLIPAILVFIRLESGCHYLKLRSGLALLLLVFCMGRSFQVNYSLKETSCATQMTTIPGDARLIYSFSAEENFHQPFQKLPTLNEFPVVYYIGWLRQIYLSHEHTRTFIENIHRDIFSDGVYLKGAHRNIEMVKDYFHKYTGGQSKLIKYNDQLYQLRMTSI